MLPADAIEPAAAPCCNCTGTPPPSRRRRLHAAGRRDRSRGQRERAPDRAGERRLGPRVRRRANGCSPRRRRDHFAGADRHRVRSEASMNRLGLLLIAVVVVAAFRADARACSIAAPTQHVLDPSMQATDQVAADAAAHSGRAGHAREGSQAGGMQSERLQLRRHRHHHDRRAQQPTTSPIRSRYRLSVHVRIGRIELRAVRLPTSRVRRRTAGRLSDAHLARRRHGRSGDGRLSRCRWWRSILPATRARRRQSGSSTTATSPFAPWRATTPRALASAGSRRWPCWPPRRPAAGAARRAQARPAAPRQSQATSRP